MPDQASFRQLPEMIINILFGLFAFLFPAIILFAEKKYKPVKWISPIVICYLMGIFLGNLDFLPYDREVPDEISKFSISLAIPLLLFNSNVMEWIGYAGKAFLSYVLSIISVIISSGLMHYFYRMDIDNTWQISGMLVGVYTGGTPNMSAIGMALETPEEIFVILNSSDVVLGAVYFLFLITIGRKFLGLFLGRFKESQNIEPQNNLLQNPQISRKQLIFNVLVVLLLGLAILGLSAWISMLIKGEIAGPWVILIMTSLGIGMSFVKKIRRIRGSYETAHYLLLIFSLAIGMLADIDALIGRSSGLFVYCALVMFGAIIIHFALAALFRIDRDTFIITSTAAIYGPAFVGPVANAIQNKKVIVSGITMGLLGYAIGNYLGIGVAMLLK
ncbi:MAG: DUF819 family protein [Cyclobacteriaceae bacterium]|nr:DUF819 family protein [Cyclobacteriaceae bacterium]